MVLRNKKALAVGFVNLLSRNKLDLSDHGTKKARRVFVLFCSDNII